MNYPEGQVAIEKMGMLCIRQCYALPNLNNDVGNYLKTIVSGIITLIFLIAAVVNGFSLEVFLGVIHLMHLM